MKHNDGTHRSRPKPKRSRRLNHLLRLSLIVMVGLMMAISGYLPAAAQTQELTVKDLTDSSLTADQLAQALVGSGGQVTISNVQYTGDKGSAGTFSGGNGIIGFDSGIILSTGNVAGVKGPNGIEENNTGQTGTGDTDLTTLAGQNTFDAAILSFDFVPDGDNVFFNFVFASEEYTKYVNEGYNDVFAFYVNGTNCALVGGKPVSINTINKGRSGVSGDTDASNPDFYINNPVNSNTLNTQMNGLTRVLNCGAAVNKGQQNTMKLAIADAGDSRLDSNVFIEAGSLTTIPPTATPVPPTPTPLPPTEVPPTAVPVATNAKPCLAKGWGDVHYVTCDGLVYDFQEVGDFLVTQSASKEVIIQSRKEVWVSNPSVSINVAIAIKVGNDKLEFYQKPTRSFFINDTATELPTTDLKLPGGGSIKPTFAGSTDDFTIVWADLNTIVRIIYYPSTSHLDVHMSYYNGSLTYEGLFGNMDGDANNDMQIRGGEVVQQPYSSVKFRTFAYSWRLSVEESLFDNPAPPPPAPNESDPVAEQVTIVDFDVSVRSEAQQKCLQAGISDQSALDGCTIDIAATGDDTFLASAKNVDEAIKVNPPTKEPVRARPFVFLVVGQQYAVGDVPGTFRYFKLIELPASEREPAKLELCQDASVIGLVYLNDILTEKLALAKGLKASNQPCATSAGQGSNPPVVESTPVPADNKNIRYSKANGDVHILTADGLRYDFQEVGDFIGLRSTTGGVMVQARQEQAPNSSASVNTAAAMQVGNDKLEFYLNKGGTPIFTVNDQATPLPTTKTSLPDGGTIEPYSTGFQISWPDGNTGVRILFWPDCLDIFTGRFTPALTYEGVYGNFDGDPNNDIQIRNGAVITPEATSAQLKEFGDSWRVPQGESLFDTPSTATSPAQTAPTLAEVDATKREEAKKKCDAAGITNQIALYDCTYDVAVTDNESFIDSAKGVDAVLKEQPPVQVVDGSDAPGLEVLTNSPPTTEVTVAPAVEVTVAPADQPTPTQATAAPASEPAADAGLLNGLLKNPFAIVGLIGFLIGIVVMFMLRRRR
ncbi:MAG: choice-of-anchor L domain-containing protein [Herpetosiphon sp.]|nr:choice-of-anchor L domain-containing protein [Herpetosiphon sp.]